MKKYCYSVLVIAMFLMSCKQDRTVDVTVMPKETTTGANTFGCVIDDWIYVGGRYFLPVDKQSIKFNYTAANRMEVKVKVKDIGKTYEWIVFTINAPIIEKQKTPFSNAKWIDINGNPGEDLGSGNVDITRFDEVAKIISGRVTGDRIKHGQFDVMYAEKN